VANNYLKSGEAQHHFGQIFTIVVTMLLYISLL